MNMIPNPNMIAREEAHRQITDERRRQVTQEGWTPEHDDSHTEGELVDAAMVYYHVAIERIHWSRVLGRCSIWPWSLEWFKPWKKDLAAGEKVVDRRRCLVKAGALIRAERERLVRIEERIVSS